MTPPGFLFSGQLAEAVGMGRDFWESDPEARELFERTSERCGRDLEKLLFEGPADELHENLAAQAGVYLVSTLAARALEREGIRPAATAGYSLGNYAALVAAGAVSYEDALEVLIAVWRSIHCRAPNLGPSAALHPAIFQSRPQPMASGSTSSRIPTVPPRSRGSTFEPAAAKPCVRSCRRIRPA